MDPIRSNKKGLRHGRFCSFQCFKIWSDCLNFKHWPILSSASGALLIFTVKSTLNYTRVLRQSTTTTTTTKKKKQSIILRSEAVVCDIWSGRTRFGNSFMKSGTDKPCWSKQKRRGRKRVRSIKRCILLSLSVRQPLIFWTRRLHLDVLHPQCIHTCHTNGLIIRLPLLMIRVNRLFTAQRSAECWIFWQCLDNDVINLCCGRLPLFSCLSNIHVKWPFRAF